MKGPVTGMAEEPVLGPVDAPSDVESAADLAAPPGVRLWLRLSACTIMLEHRIAARLKSEFGITRPRMDVLAALDGEAEGLTMGEISKRLMVTNGAVTGLVERLAAAGLVERLSLPADRRTHIVRLSPSGSELCHRVAVARAGWLTEWTAGMAREETAQLLALLDRLKRSLRTVAKVR